MTSTARPAIATRVPIATISIVALVLVPSSLLARQRSSQTTQAEVQSSVAANPSSVTGNADDKKAQKKGKDAEAKPKPSRLSRWFELQIGTVSLRQRTIVNSRDVRTTSQIQDSGQFKGRFKFDPKGRYTVNAVYATGNTFTGGWNNTGIGTGDSFNHWYLKQFYVAAVPAPGVEISVGGFGVMRGESTEITTYDNDGYLVGERVSVKRPKEFFLDEFGVTSAYLGDLTSPSITNRYTRLSDEPNYVQFFATKNVTRQLTASAEYSRLTGVPTFRYAVVARTLPLVIVDMVRFEQYFRRDPQGGSGVRDLRREGHHQAVCGRARICRYRQSRTHDQRGPVFSRQAFLRDSHRQAHARIRRPVLRDAGVAQHDRDSERPSAGTAGDLQRGQRPPAARHLQAVDKLDAGPGRGMRGRSGVPRDIPASDRLFDPPPTPGVRGPPDPREPGRRHQRGRSWCTGGGWLVVVHRQGLETCAELQPFSL